MVRVHGWKSEFPRTLFKAAEPVLGSWHSTDQSVQFYSLGCKHRATGRCGHVRAAPRSPREGEIQPPAMKPGTGSRPRGRHILHFPRNSVSVEGIPPLPCQGPPSDGMTAYVQHSSSRTGSVSLLTGHCSTAAHFQPLPQGGPIPQ